MEEERSHPLVGNKFNLHTGGYSMENIFGEIEKMSLEELIELNKFIAQRAKALSFQQRAKASCKFQSGQKVRFTSKEGQMQEGSVIKVNRTTVDVMCNGAVWRVSSDLLSRAE
jgi:hypothetical protein